MAEIVHGTAVLVGTQGVLIRGRSGAGKSGLAHALMERGARLIADDRVCLAVRNRRIAATAPAVISGLIELRGRGLISVPHEKFAIIRLVADIVADEDLDRMPEPDELFVTLFDVDIPRQPVPAAGEPACRLIDAALAAQSLRHNIGLRSAQL